MSHANLSLVSLVSKALLGSGNGGGDLPQCNAPNLRLARALDVKQQPEIDASLSFCSPDSMFPSSPGMEPIWEKQNYNSEAKRTQWKPQRAICTRAAIRDGSFLTQRSGSWV